MANEYGADPGFFAGGGQQWPCTAGAFGACADGGSRVKINIRLRYIASIEYSERFFFLIFSFLLVKKFVEKKNWWSRAGGGGHDPPLDPRLYPPLYPPMKQTKRFTLIANVVFYRLVTTGGRLAC